MRGVTGGLTWSEWCEGILDEYLQFVRANGWVASQHAVAKAERALYRKYYGRGANSLVNRPLSSEHALKLRCVIKETVLGLRGTHLTSDQREDILRRYLAFINANHGRPPCQHSVGTVRSLYQQYRRAKRELPNEQP